MSLIYFDLIRFVGFIINVNGLWSAKPAFCGCAPFFLVPSLPLPPIFSYVNTIGNFKPCQFNRILNKSY